MTIRVNSAVHYVSSGTPTCLAATVTELASQAKIGVAVLAPVGLSFVPLIHGGTEYADPAAETPGDSGCIVSQYHGNPFRFCQCGWVEAGLKRGTWHRLDECPS